MESLQYDLSSIVAATNNFADANKLGQGGFGAVYKVIMGNRIAKHLSECDFCCIHESIQLSFEYVFRVSFVMEKK